MTTTVERIFRPIPPWILTFLPILQVLLDGYVRAWLEYPKLEGCHDGT